MNNFTEESYTAFKEAAAERYDFATCQRSDGSYYGTGGQCRLGAPAQKPEKEKKGKASGGGGSASSAGGSGSSSKAKAGEVKRDPSKDIKRGGKTIGTSPRNMLVDNIKKFEKRLKGAKSEGEKKLLQDTIAKAKAQLKKEDEG
jgi:hypothetical protein